MEITHNNKTYRWIGDKWGILPFWPWEELYWLRIATKDFDWEMEEWTVSLMWTLRNYYTLHTPEQLVKLGYLEEVKPLSQKRAEAIERGNKEMENKPLPYGSCGCEWILHPFWVLCVNCNAGRSIHATIQGESKMITEEERDDLLKMWWDFVWENKPRQPQEDIELLPSFDYDKISETIVATWTNRTQQEYMLLDKVSKQVSLLTSTVNQLIQANKKPL